MGRCSVHTTVLMLTVEIGEHSYHICLLFVVRTVCLASCRTAAVHYYTVFLVQHIIFIASFTPKNKKVAQLLPLILMLLLSPSKIVMHNISCFVIDACFRVLILFCF